MLKKTTRGWEVRSESSNKRLSKPGLSKKAAVKRLQQVEYFKHHPEAAGK